MFSSEKNKIDLLLAFGSLCSLSQNLIGSNSIYMPANVTPNVGIGNTKAIDKCIPTPINTSQTRSFFIGNRKIKLNSKS
ncbi:hypothetical protein, partial [Pontibacter rugosus]